MAFKTFVNGVNLPASDVNDYLMKQSVMTFASSGARASALTVPVEGMFTYLADVDRYEFWNGTSWQLVDSGIFADSAARTSGVTSPVEGIQSFLKATSATDTASQIDFYNGSAWESIYTPGRNAIINGGFDIWQRGSGNATATSATTGYTADRWQLYRTGYVTGASCWSVTGPTGVSRGARVYRTNGNASTAAIGLAQTIESSTSIPFAGQRVTLSFWARRGADFSSTSYNLASAIVYGTGTDQNISSGFTSQTIVATVSNSLTLEWQRFSLTGTVSSSATQLAVQFTFAPTGTAGANDYFEVAGVQLEAGSVATPFRRAGGTLQGELAACQRYYYRVNAATTATQFAIGRTTSTADSQTRVQLPVSMRTVPSTTLDWSGTIGHYSIIEGVNARTTSGTPTVSVNSTPEAAVINMGISGATGGLFATLAATNLAAYLGFSAEL